MLHFVHRSYPMLFLGAVLMTAGAAAGWPAQIFASEARSVSGQRGPGADGDPARAPGDHFESELLLHGDDSGIYRVPAESGPYELATVRGSLPLTIENVRLARQGEWLSFDLVNRGEETIAAWAFSVKELDATGAVTNEWIYMMDHGLEQDPTSKLRPGQSVRKTISRASTETATLLVVVSGAIFDDARYLGEDAVLTRIFGSRWVRTRDLTRWLSRAREIVGSSTDPRLRPALRRLEQELLEAESKPSPSAAAFLRMQLLTELELLLAADDGSSEPLRQRVEAWLEHWAGEAAHYRARVPVEFRVMPIYRY